MKITRLMSWTISTRVGRFAPSEDPRTAAQPALGKARFGRSRQASRTKPQASRPRPDFNVVEPPIVHSWAVNPVVHRVRIDVSGECLD